MGDKSSCYIRETFFASGSQKAQHASYNQTLRVYLLTLAPTANSFDGGCGINASPSIKIYPVSTKLIRYVAFWWTYEGTSLRLLKQGESAASLQFSFLKITFNFSLQLILHFRYTRGIGYHTELKAVKGFASFLHTNYVHFLIGDHGNTLEHPRKLWVLKTNRAKRLCLINEVVLILCKRCQSHCLDVKKCFGTANAEFSVGAQSLTD